MAYWNPFGWSEDERRSIQSVVRPIMQVASIAGSMGAFKGGGGETGGTIGEADFDAAPTLPEGVVPGTEGIGITDIGPDGSMTESFMPDSDGSLAMPDGTQLAPKLQASPVMPAPDATIGADGFGNTGVKDWDNQSTALKEAYFKQPAFEAQESILQETKDWDTKHWDPEDTLKQQSERQFQDVAQAEGLVVEPLKEKADVTQITPQQPKTKTAGTQEIKNTAPKPEGENGPGPGGKEKGFLEAFNWKNIQEFLASDEGKKWMLSDEGLFGIGQKLTAAAEHGTSTFTALTLKERKKLLDRLKKERAERKEEEKEKEKEKNK